MTDQPTYPDHLFLPPEAFESLSKYLNISGEDHVSDGEPVVEYIKRAPQGELIKAVVAGMPELVWTPDGSIYEMSNTRFDQHRVWAGYFRPLNAVGGTIVACPKAAANLHHRAQLAKTLKKGG
ncbi:MAG: hypothetical protein COB08_016780 [Rhodobacteraceae bacterium]|nr:hypothetical protein [Paracoccaceae bacterium]